MLLLNAPVFLSGLAKNKLALSLTNTLVAALLGQLPSLLLGQIAAEFSSY